eukprot:CAMPEP_0119514152 /NCGR_PEP_ID=MMETSP1344-20130328/32049_1 /TAXON_ID=236787 /ORGANISM="Florenciella parvula, Strain CCMP2471" /LENGTH=95 /DNA_ID=CAMNT_0007551443 /DNA_START=666 /DNA_END=950 /DNA_ORIENTATION=+
MRHAFVIPEVIPIVTVPIGHLKSSKDKRRDDDGTIGGGRKIVYRATASPSPPHRHRFTVTASDVSECYRATASPSTVTTSDVSEMTVMLMDVDGG